MTTTPFAIPDLDGDLAYPRRNGEPIFDAPWQSRAFGMVVSMNKAGIFEWDEFKDRLIQRIARHSGPDAATADAARYYECWTAAFFDLLVAKNLLAATEIAERQQEYLTGARQDVH